MSSSTTNTFQSPSVSGTKKKKKKKKSTGGAPPSMPNQAKQPQQQPPQTVIPQQQPPRPVTQGGSLQQQPPCQVQQQPQPPIKVLPHHPGAIVSENAAIATYVATLRDAAARCDTGHSLSPVLPTLPPAQATASTLVALLHQFRLAKEQQHGSNIKPG
jgi:hypothetical protein